MDAQTASEQFRGKEVNVFGPSSGGKTTFALWLKRCCRPSQVEVREYMNLNTRHPTWCDWLCVGKGTGSIASWKKLFHDVTYNSQLVIDDFERRVEQEDKPWTFACLRMSDDYLCFLRVE